MMSWLVADFALFGQPIQHWMLIVAIVIGSWVLLAPAIESRSQRDQTGKASIPYGVWR